LGARSRILVIICTIGIIALGLATSAWAFDAEDLPFGFGSQGWQAGLGLSQETIRSLGLFGYEKTGIGGFLTHPDGTEEPASWFGGHKQVFMGNVGYTLELFAGNTRRPILSTFMTSVDPHVGAYGEVNRMYGHVGHGLAGTAQLFVTELGQFEYSISPYIQFTRQGIWRFSLSLGSAFGLGMSYSEPTEKVMLDVMLVNEGVSFHVLFSMTELPMTLGVGMTQDQIQAFVRYQF
jgi:hypothetical protein